jgi:hypothetical protein
MPALLPPRTGSLRLLHTHSNPPRHFLIASLSALPGSSLRSIWKKATASVASLLFPLSPAPPLFLSFLRLAYFLSRLFLVAGCRGLPCQNPGGIFSSDGMIHRAHGA